LAQIAYGLLPRDVIARVEGQHTPGRLDPDAYAALRLVWKPGQSGNPAGRPPSSRQKISERLLQDLAAIWEEHGKTVLERLAKDDPGKLATIAYGLLPKDVFARVEDQRTPGNLEPEAWAALRRVGM
jgi:hypothetical protein